MKLELGKAYRTRDGRKAEVLFIVPEEYSDEYPVVLGTEDDERIDTTYEGKYIKGYKNEEDIVSEWREPIKIEGWVNVYPCDRSVVYRNKEIADERSQLGRIACIKVTGVEGEL